MEGGIAQMSEKKKKMKKAHLSNTVGGGAGVKVTKREMILNRMSSGKKRPRSEPRINKRSSEAPQKEDILAKRLFDHGSDGEDDGEKRREKIKVKTPKAKRQVEKTPIGKKLLGTASKWQVTDTKPAAQEPEQGESTKKMKKAKGSSPEPVQGESTKKKKKDKVSAQEIVQGESTKKMKKAKVSSPEPVQQESTKKMKKAKVSSPEPVQGESTKKIKKDKVSAQELVEKESTKKVKKARLSGKKLKSQQENVDDDDDGEIDFPILKRKSLGVASNVSNGTQLVIEGTKIPHESLKKKEKKRRGDKKKELKGKENVKAGKGKKDEAPSDGKESRGEEEKKKRRKRRGKKRKRSNSESEEPHAKRGKQAAVDKFAVRCGNLPAGTSQSDLEMFIGEADIFPKSINIKAKRRSRSGQRKPVVRYATIVCNSVEEVEKLCALNGISMPSSVGNRECKLLIHAMTADHANDTSMLFKRKLFIRNLHYKATEEDLLAYFDENHFNPSNVIFPRKGDAKKTKGTALVWLNTPGDAARALAIKNPTLRDKGFTILRTNKPSFEAQEP